MLRPRQVHHVCSGNPKAQRLGVDTEVSIGGGLQAPKRTCRGGERQGAAALHCEASVLRESKPHTGVTLILKQIRSEGVGGEDASALRRGGQPLPAAAAVSTATGRVSERSLDRKSVV